MPKETLLEKCVRIFFYIIAIPLFTFISPFSHLYEFFTQNPLFRGTCSPEAHRIKVAKVQQQVLDWNKNGKQKRMCTARKRWQSIITHYINKSQYTQIDIGDLDCIVEINKVDKILTVELGMCMGRLLSILLPVGFTIPVVPELDVLTVGLETSSHKYGEFFNTCIELEVKICSKDKNSDLFFAIPNTYGTIGFLTAVRFPLIPAAKYVQLEYFPLNCIDQAVELLKTTSDDNIEFVEGIVFGPDKIVVMQGRMTDHANTSKINSVNRWYKPWFFKHVENFLKKPKSDRFIEYIPLKDYYYRHKRCCFWVIQEGIPFGNHVLIRYILGWFYPCNIHLLKLLCPFRNMFPKNFVLQDIGLPMCVLKNSLEFLHDLVQVYPLWLCPLKVRGHFIPKNTPPHFVDNIFVDIGIYGTTSLKNEYDHYITGRKIEEYVLRNDGLQAMYADSFLTREEFKKMFQLDNYEYETIREKYGCKEAFPDVYDKISSAARKV